MLILSTLSSNKDSVHLARMSVLYSLCPRHVPWGADRAIASKLPGEVCAVLSSHCVCGPNVAQMCYEAESP
jgi:hypothetical protein